MKDILPMNQVLMIVGNSGGADVTLGYALGTRRVDDDHSEQQFQQWVLYRGYEEDGPPHGTVTLKAANDAWAGANTPAAFDDMARHDPNLQGGNYVRVNCRRFPDELDLLPSLTPDRYPPYPTPLVDKKPQTDTGTFVLFLPDETRCGYVHTTRDYSNYRREHWILLKGFPASAPFSVAPLAYEDFRVVFSDEWLEDGATFTFVLASCIYYGDQVPAAG